MKVDNKNHMPIGFFDSGVGGISILRETVKFMPNENYIYFGDSKNAPYGPRPIEEAKALTFEAIEFLISKGCKAIVVACNTATSIAIDDLRDRYDLPIIGIEPALKPAIELNKEGKIVIMATTITLAEKKFKALVDKFDINRNIVPLPCPGLVEFIENGDLESNELKQFLKDKLRVVENDKIASIVLGCTHYPFIKELLKEIVGESVEIIDGSLGTSKELKRKLEEFNIKSDKNEKGTIEIYNSKNDNNTIEFSYRLLNL